MSALESFQEPTSSALLQAIGDTSLDLANVGDRQLMLAGILRRTRALLAADMAYISLNDLGSGTTYIHLTDGVRTQEYREIRMPLGTGVLGAAAAGAATVHTVNYLPDPALHHLEDIDAIVAGEGVRAIAGAPMRLGGRIVGALLVAHRAPRELGPGAQAALEQMAVQGAVALEQTRRGEEIRRLRASGTGGSDADDRRRLEELLRLDRRLMGAMASSTPEADGAFAVLAEAVGQPLSLYEPSGTLRAGPRLLEPADLEDWRLRAAIRSSQRGGAVALVHLARGTLAVLALTTAGEHLATLVMEEVGTEVVASVEHASAFLSAALLVEQALAAAHESAQSDLVEELVDSRSALRPNLGTRLAHFGVHPGEPTAVVVADIDPARLAAAGRLARSVIDPTNSLTSTHDGHLCLIANRSRVPELGRLMHDTLTRAGHTVVVGTAVSAQGAPVELRRAHEEATDVATAARALGRHSGVVDFAAVGPAGVLIRDRSGATARALVDRHLGPVLAYDRTRGSELAATLWHYFSSGELLAPTAAALQVHANTVRQRLERIDELLGPSWRSADGRFHTHLALRLWRTIEVPSAREQ